jgi:hypothetical protein
LDGGTLSILIGEDDETWDVAFTLPDIALAEIVNAVS